MCSPVPQSFYRLTSSESPVYEYMLRDQWIMMDMDDGYILWTGIWKGQCGWLSISGQISTSQNQRSVIRKVRWTNYEKQTLDDTVCCQPTS